MSTRTVSFFLNGKPVEIKSPATAAVLEVSMLTKDILSDSLQAALDKKSIPANAPEGTAPVAMREFFVTQFSEGKNADDVFRVEIVHDDGRTYTSEARRQVIANRLIVASNISDYLPTIVKSVPEGTKTAAPKAAATASADDI